MPRKETPQKRIVLGDAHGHQVTDSIWAQVPGAGVFVLLYDYPGVVPTAGWTVLCDGVVSHVTAVSGRTLHCEVTP